MDEYVKESIMEMCSIVGENNTIDFLMVDKILFIESEEIPLQHFFLQMVPSTKQHTGGKIATTVTKQKTLHDF